MSAIEILLLSAVKKQLVVSVEEALSNRFFCPAPGRWDDSRAGPRMRMTRTYRSWRSTHVLQLFASGLGTLAFFWATVVLLGGFSTMLSRLDFWFITAIVFIETARVVGYNSGPEAKFFIEVPAVFWRDNLFGRFSTAPVLIAQAPIVAATACVTLSIVRVVGIARHYGYGGPNHTDGSNGNLKPALILFYTLVLTQGALFFLWLGIAMNRRKRAENLKEYFDNSEVIKLMDGMKLMHKYVIATFDTCIEKGVVCTMNRTLVSFAAELLQSEYSGDHVSAVSLLYVLISRKEREAGVVHQICASEKFAGRLFQLISFKSPLDRNTKLYTAEIVEKIAGKLRLSDIPEAAHSISSLLEGHVMETVAQTSLQTPGENPTIMNTDSGPRGKPVSHGLLILCGLADDPENCTKIYETPGLVPKIVTPISHGLPKFMGNDGKTIQIVKASLVVAAKLTSGTGETSTKIRRKISKDGRVAENLIWILQRSIGMVSTECSAKKKKDGKDCIDHDMEILALEILPRLNLGGATAAFIDVLGGLPFDAQNSPLKMPAVQALHTLAADQATCQLIIGKQGRQNSLIQQLVNIITSRNDGSEHRAVTAGKEII
ncbi:hypothetical protein EJB05_25238, partial [Eragrostis curvula]